MFCHLFKLHRGSAVTKQFGGSIMALPQVPNKGKCIVVFAQEQTRNHLLSKSHNLFFPAPFHLLCEIKKISSTSPTSGADYFPLHASSAVVDSEWQRGGGKEKKKIDPRICLIPDLVTRPLPAHIHRRGSSGLADATHNMVAR